METKKDRLEQFIRTMGYSIREFERAIGVSNGTVRHVTDTLSANIKEKISAKFPQLSMEWLLTGKGTMLPEPNTTPDETTTGELPEKVLRGSREVAERSVQKMTPKNTQNSIPLIPIEAVAGWNGIDQEGVLIADCTHYQVPEFIEAGAEYLIRVSGSSMYPKYSNGDILACRRVPEITFFQWGKIYVIDSIQGAMVKRLFQCDTNPDNVLCKSDNPNYPPFELPKSEIRSLSVVVGVVRLE